MMRPTAVARMLRTSEILTRLAAQTEGERVSLFEILARIRARAFGVFLIVFAVPNLLPMPPGFSTIAGALILIVAIQLVIGRTSLWLPERLGYRSMQTRHLLRVIDWTVPKLRRIERLSRPRFVWLTRIAARRPIGVLIVVLASIMALPIPVVGNSPPALAITLMGFGMLERDGVWVGAGIVVGIVAIAVIAGLAFGLFRIATLIPAGLIPF
ncbi:MAG: exopolysaccharide biosynthesis protein [Microvirga sp.]|nr:exopolysaccharide biosynthesis protein [Microvirga sp.]